MTCSRRFGKKNEKNIEKEGIRKRKEEKGRKKRKGMEKEKGKRDKIFFPSRKKKGKDDK